MRWISIPAVLTLLTVSCAASGPSLRDERDRAVRAGLRWLDTYLGDEWNAAVLGEDAVAIFADYAATAVDEPSRDFALAAARRQALDLAGSYLARSSFDEDELLDIFLLLTQMRELGLDDTHLLEAVTEGILALPDPDLVYGLESLSPAALSRLPEGRLFRLLLGVYVVERAAAAGYDFGIRFGLKELWPVLMRRPLIDRDRDPDPAKALFRSHVYRATHIAYVLTDYGRLRQREEDAPEVFRYLRRAFPDVLAAGDVELVAEIVDVLRSLGHDETGSALVRKGTAFLLSSQHEDGSWGPGRAHEDAYLGAHHTWCAIAGLGERRVLENTPYERHLRKILDQLR